MSDPGRDAHTFVGPWDGQLVATAVHNGHDLRPEIAEAMILDEDTRRREEDPCTDEIGAGIASQVVVHRSRFEVDLNRVRTKAVYRTPEDCWGLDVWRGGELPDELVAGSLQVYDDFYAALAERLDRLAERGPFVVYDVHSYNHRRNGADADPDPPEEHPEVNVGTGSLDRERFGPVVDAFEAAFEKEGYDVRENIRFKGAGVAMWVHERYPDLGCVLALEFKKTYMDEWTGEVDHDRVHRLRTALARTVGPTLEALDAL